MIRVAFRVGDRRLLARLIHLWDRTDVSHCEVATAWGQNVHDCISSSWLDGGVRRKLIAMDPAKWRIYELPDFSPELAQRWFLRHAGDGYDWLGLIGFLIRPVRGFGRRQFCSESCAEMLGLDEAWRYTPRSVECFVARIGRRVI